MNKIYVENIAQRGNKNIQVCGNQNLVNSCLNGDIINITLNVNITCNEPAAISEYLDLSSLKDMISNFESLISKVERIQNVQ